MRNFRKGNSVLGVNVGTSSDKGAFLSFEGDKRGEPSARISHGWEWENGFLQLLRGMRRGGKQEEGLVRPWNNPEVRM
jgi:hypothetical protein